MLERITSRFTTYGAIWNRQSRRRLGNKVFETAFRIRAVLFHSTLRALRKPERNRQVECRISVLGVPVFVRQERRERYRIALLVDEFFGGWDTAIGGYGALARNYICRFIPDDDIQIDLLMTADGGPTTQQQLIDQTMVYRLPSRPDARQRWLDKQGYNLFLSIEMTEPSFEILSQYKSDLPLLYWVQDPRDLDMYQSRLKTVSRLRDADWSYIKDVTIWMQTMMRERRVSFISQGESLSAIARTMYKIPDSIAIQDLANPVKLDADYTLGHPPKEDKVIFLGRLEAQKRVWIVCEIAKAMPQYQFYVLGATGKGRDEEANAKTLEPYRNLDGSSKIANLHFAGHVDGEAKSQHVKSAKLLLNTSIWEGIPVSWLEALSFGTLIVSAFDRDDIVARFGTFVGEVMGDGTDQETIAKFARAVDYWMNNDGQRTSTAQKAIDFVRDRHSIDAFTRNMRNAILRAIP